MPAVTQIITPQSRRFLARQPAEEKSTSAAAKVITFFKEIQAGTGTMPDDEVVVFQLAKEDYAQIEHTLKQDENLAAFIADKLRYDYDADRRKLIVRMPSAVHERCIDQIENDIRTQLQRISNGTGKKARFAKEVAAFRSSQLSFKNTDSTFHPDATFRHSRAKYPGVIIEVAFSQESSILYRRAEDYLLESGANIRVVVGIHFEYSNESREVTMSIWRGKFSNTANGLELSVMAVIEDQAFRDKEGRYIANQGLQLNLSDFTYEDLARKALGTEDEIISISSQKLYEYVQSAESVTQTGKGTGHSRGDFKVRRRTPTPPEDMQPNDEDAIAKKERAMEQKLDEADPDYRGR